MAVSMADITKLRKMTGAGMMDCKNALTEAEGDFDKAMEIIRKKGQAVAAKRSEREAAEGCVLAKTTGDRAVIIALKCETDFVAQNADYVKLTQDILDLAVANKCKTLEEVKALPMGNGTVQDAVVDRSGITGEKMELDGYMTVEGASTAVYNHMNRNGLCTIVAFNKNVDEQLAKQVREQINSRKEEYLARVHARREERQRLLARLSERAELLMKEEFTSKVDELIGEDKREEYAKIKKNISREMTKMHDRTDRSYIRAARHLKGNPTAVSKRFSEALAELRKHMDEK